MESKFKTILALIVALVMIAPIFAKGLDLEDEQSPIEYNTLDISGKFKKRPRRLTPSEKLKVYRARLEKRNKILMEKRVEQMRIKSEVRMIKRMQKSFDNQMKVLDQEFDAMDSELENS